MFSTWERMGIPGPKASSILLGNFAEIITEGRIRMHKVWTEQYGKVYGYYDSSGPVLITADPDMAKEILIKQFDKFEQRIVFLDNNDNPTANIFETRGEKWKRVRGISTPTFSARKMKMMSPLVHQSIDRLMERFQKHAKAQEDFDVYEDWKCLTLDVITSIVFSYDTDVFNSKDSIFLKKLRELFDNLDPRKMSFVKRLQILVCTISPSLLKITKLFNPRIASPPVGWFENLAKRMIEDRQSSGENRNDYIQLMLNVNRRQAGNLSGSETDSDLSDNEMSRELRKYAKSKQMTMEEMQGQCAVFLAAGYETTATTLAFFSHYMALYPDIQSKLQQEVDEYFPVPSQNINYETVQKLPYLEMIFCEVSRLASIGQLGVQRICNEATKVGDVTIPKGTRVIINGAAIHMDSELWGPEPTDQLVPERFLQERKGERHSMAYLPFGGGPKNCIGMRFAIMEAKMAIINMMQRYSIEKCDKTQVPLKCNQEGVHGPSEGVYIRLKERH